MAELILENNIRWDWALINQVKKYKQGKTVPDWLIRTSPLLLRL